MLGNVRKAFSGLYEHPRIVFYVRLGDEQAPRFPGIHIQWQEREGGMPLAGGNPFDAVLCLER